MKFAMKSIVATAAFAALGAASAATPVTVNAGDTTSAEDWSFAELTGSSQFRFSSDLVGAISGPDVKVAALSPAVVTTELRPNGLYKGVSVDAPLASFTGTLDGAAMAVNGFSTNAGFVMTTKVDPEGYASTGGSLEIKNLRADLDQMLVYGTLVGGNNVGTVNNVALWDIGAVGGDTSFAVTSGANSASVLLSGLKIQEPAFNLLSQSLGLNAIGVASLVFVEDFGTLEAMVNMAAVRAGGPVDPPVPEPSTYMLMGLGLVGMSLLARQRRRKAG